MENTKALHIVLLVGGASPEREVSKDSSKSIRDSLINLGHTVHLVDPAYGLQQPAEVEDFFKPGELFPASHKNYVEAFTLDVFKNADLVFIGLHGKWGEDGTVQSLLELLGIPFTGSGVLASSLAMDKAIAKIIMRNNGVKVPDGFLINRDKVDVVEINRTINNTFGYPCIIKPNDQGSTCGLSVCKKENELNDALKLCLEYTDSILIEEFIPGRELTVGILDRVVLPPLEIRPKHGLYDYECKYTDGMSDYLVPAPITYDIDNQMRDQTIRAISALGCRVYSRADFRLTPDDKIYCLEVNTLPGMTSHSLIPKMAKAAGISFDELVDQIVKLSLKHD
jgi:D-alanine-D-alanine ligase